MIDQEIISKYGLRKYVPGWEHYLFQERILRFGVEARNYFTYGGRFDPCQADCQELIQQSFIDDMIRFIKNNSHLSFEKIRHRIVSKYKNNI